MKIDLEIETFDKKLDFDLFETKERLERGMTKQLENGVSLEYKGTEIRLGVGFPDIILLVLDIASSVAVGLFVSWLYDKLKNRATKIKINEIEVEIDKEEIKKLLIRQIERQ